MKSLTFFTIALLGVFSLNAQDGKKSEIRVTIQKDGESIKDTVYMVEDDARIEHASKILDMTFGEVKPSEKHKVMTFISDDGELHEFHSGDKEMMEAHKMHKEHAKMGTKHEMKWVYDSDDEDHVFVTTEEGEDGETKVIVKKIKMGDKEELHEILLKEGISAEEKEMMMKMIHEGDDDTQVFVTTEEGEDGEMKVMVKKIRISEDGDESTLDEEQNVFIMKSGEEGEMRHFKHNGEEPVWIEKDGGKVLIIDSKDGKQKKIMVVTDSDSDYEFTTEEGETIIVHTSKEGDTDKEIKVEVIVDGEKVKVESDKKKGKKKKKK